MRSASRRYPGELLTLVGLLVSSSALASSPSLEQRVQTVFERAEALSQTPITLRRLRVAEGRVQIGIELPSDVSLADLPTEVENRLELAIGAIEAEHPDTQIIDVLVAHPGEALRPPPRPRFELPAPPERVEAVVPDPARFPYGQSLRGKVVAISPGHGYIYYSSIGDYSTQRSNTKWNGCGECRGIVEDFETHEIVVNDLIPLLEGAGARVVMVRERDYNSVGTIVDDGDSNYQEQGGPFIDGASAGGQQGDYRTTDAAGSSATWTVAAPTSGSQLLSMWFVAGSNRSADAQLEVTGPGGVFDYTIDLRTQGQRFVPIELFDLQAAQTLSVRLASGSSGFIVADTMRLGAGTHSSGHPWWSMGAAPFATYQNAPASIQGISDVTTRPLYAEWFGADVYISLHSNAAGAENSTTGGTSTYRFNCLQYADHSSDPPASSCDDPIGSDRLQELVHNSLLDSLRADWDPAWRDRGSRVANFGELRALDGIPGILIESAFHDNVALPSGNLRATDNEALHDPRWRRSAAYGIYRGVSEFLVGEGPLVLDPPSSLVARRIDASSVELSFDPVPGARGYRVYAASGSRSFDQGRLATAPPIRIDGLTPEMATSFKISALNEAGEGRPSRVVSARPSLRPPQVLIVDAFDREDAWVQHFDNRHNTSLIHALALGGSQLAFDGCDEEALKTSKIALSSYEAVVLALGRESTQDEVLTPELRGNILAFAQGGGSVLMDGSEIAWTLDARGDDESRNFMSELFGASFERDDSGSKTLVAGPNGWLASLADPIALGDGNDGAVEAFSSDVLRPQAGSIVELLYENGSDVAAVRKGNNLLIAVALDSMVRPELRATLLTTWAEAALDIAPPDPPPDGGVISTPDAGVVPVDSGQPPATPDAGVTPPMNEDGGQVEPPIVEPPVERLIATREPPIHASCSHTQTGRGALSWWWLLLFVAPTLRRRR